MDDDFRTPAALPATWRARAVLLDQYGDPNSARLWRIAALELEQALAAQGDETLSLAEAARLSGYTTDHLSRLLARGTIPNAGRKGAPRIRRADVPQKTPHGPGRPPQREPVDRAHIRSIAAISRRREEQ